MDIQVVLPEVDEGALSQGLVAITEAIDLIAPDTVAHGFLGGYHGYGAWFENDVFMMHPFCWCDSDGCAWCDEDACGCENPEGHWFVDGAEVSSDEYWAMNKQIIPNLPSDLAEYGTPEYKAADRKFQEQVAERNERLKWTPGERLHTCECADMMVPRTAADESAPQTAPNFWHKPTGLKVWWYKYIGRDMEIRGCDEVSVPDIISACIASIGGEKGADESEDLLSD